MLSCALALLPYVENQPGDPEPRPCAPRRGFSLMAVRFWHADRPGPILCSDGLANLGPYRNFRCCGLCRLDARATIKISGIYLSAFSDCAIQPHKPLRFPPPRRIKNAELAIRHGLFVVRRLRYLVLIAQLSNVTCHFQARDQLCIA